MRSFRDSSSPQRRAWSEASDPDRDAGFTLIELMVVLLILAILLAIAIPTFLGVTGGANDKSAQANLNTALTTAKTYAEQNGQSYGTGGGGTALTTTQMTSNEPSLSWVSGATSTQGAISVWVSTDGKGVILASPSKNNTQCWYVVDNLAFVTGNASTNGGYTDTTATPGIAGNATSAPTKAGTFYGMAKGTCNASNTAFPTGAGNTPVWASSFTGA